MSKSNIEWTTETWNPIVGCSILSPGCTNCYAMKEAYRFGFNPSLERYHGLTKLVNGKAVWTGVVREAPEKTLLSPLKTKKATTYFVNSMSDLFHEDCPDEWIDKVFAVMALSPQHTFQVLTKRAARMRDYCSKFGNVITVSDGMISTMKIVPGAIAKVWPLPNVWLGVSTERQQEADERIPLLLQTPAAIRFISAEPLLGSIDLTRVRAPADPHAPDEEWLFDSLSTGDMCEQRFRNSFGEIWYDTGDGPYRETKLDWVIVGGESGPGSRPMHVGWARQLRVQCESAGVPFFFKQFGDWHPWTRGDGSGIAEHCIAWNGDISRGDELKGGGDRPRWIGIERLGKKAAGRSLDGIEYNEMPEVRA